MLVGGYVGSKIPQWNRVVGIVCVADSANGNFVEVISVSISESDTGSGNVMKSVPVFSLADSGVGQINIINIWDEIFNYSGELSVGDIFEVDSDKYLVTKNDNNARPNYTGNYPILEQGENKIFYQDSETNRTIELEIIKEDRHI